MCLISAPEALQLLWAIIADSISGSLGKRITILGAAALQILMSIIIVSIDFKEIGDFILCATLLSVAKAWMSPVIEGLMVI